MKKGLIRNDVDVNFAAFMINSLYIVLMTSLVSNHFKIRMKEYLEIDGQLTDPAIENLIRNSTEMINRLLKPV